MGDAVEMLHRWAVEIEADGTPSQIGPTPDELRAISRALAIALNGLDAIGAGRWNSGAQERAEARAFARRARDASLASLPPPPKDPA